MNPVRREYSVSTYEGWKQFAERPDRAAPERLRPDALAALGDDARREYDRARRGWHANMLLRTRQVQDIHTHIWDLVDSNLQDADRVKSAVAIDAAPALGKTTVVNAFGRDFHTQQLAEHGEYLDDGDTLHLPVCRVTLTGRMTIKGLNQMILGFYAHPATTGATPRTMVGRDLAAAAADCVARHGTRLVIVDDLHFLNIRTRDGVEVANQLKWLANEYPATFLFAGVALHQNGLLAEGRTARESGMAQTYRRWTVHPLHPFSKRIASDRQEWDRLLRSLEQRLVLARAREGMLTELSDYLFIRSTGTIGSLMDLLRRAASRAIRTGHERLDQDLFDEVRIDEAAEHARPETAASLRRRRTTDSQTRAQAVDLTPTSPRS